MLTFTLISCILVASQASARASPGPFMLSGLLPRQAGIPTADIPAQCSSQCADIANKANSCATSADITSCICAASTQQAFQSCVSCVSQIPGLTEDVQDAEQQALQSFNELCQTSGGVSSPAATSGGSGGSSPPAAASGGSGGSSPPPAATSGGSGSSSTGTPGSSGGTTVVTGGKNSASNNVLSFFTLISAGVIAFSIA